MQILALNLYTESLKSHNSYFCVMQLLKREPHSQTWKLWRKNSPPAMEWACPQAQWHSRGGCTFLEKAQILLHNPGHVTWCICSIAPSHWTNMTFPGQGQERYMEPPCKDMWPSKVLWPHLASTAAHLGGCRTEWPAEGGRVNGQIRDVGCPRGVGRQQNCYSWGFNPSPYAPLFSWSSYQTPGQKS